MDSSVGAKLSVSLWYDDVRPLEAAIEELGMFIIEIHIGSKAYFFF